MYYISLLQMHWKDQAVENYHQKVTPKRMESSKQHLESVCTPYIVLATTPVIGGCIMTWPYVWTDHHCWFIMYHIRMHT